MIRQPPHAPQGAAPTGSLTFTVDGASVCVTGRGYFSDALVDRHFEQLAKVIVSARPQHRRFDVLVDMRETTAQSPATTVRIETETRRIWTGEDRIAIVVRAGLAKMQLTRIVSDRNHRTFATIEDARQWLNTRPGAGAEA